MKAFVVAIALAAVASAEIVQPSGSAGVNNAVPQYAEARDSAYADASFGGSFSKPAVTYSSGHSLYSNDPGFSFGGSFGSNGVNVHGNSLFSSDLLNTGLNIVIGLFAFSLIMQIVSKIVSSSFFDEIFESGRSLSSDDMVYYANLARTAYEKYEEMNTPK